MRFSGERVHGGAAVTWGAESINRAMAAHGTELPITNVRCYGEFREQSGLIVLILSFVASDPERTTTISGKRK